MNKEGEVATTWAKSKSSWRFANCNINNDNENVFLTISELEQLINRLGDLFVKKGIDKKSDPTSYGLEIEDLQDKLLSKLYEIQD